jgi:hypothetical protein
MNQQQTIHVAMINSFNVLVGNVTLDDVLDSNLAVFSHYPDDEIELDNIETMILYFQEVEMFEHCSMLLKYIKDNFNNDGSRKELLCECEYPDISEYTRVIKCGRCRRTIR